MQQDPRARVSAPAVGLIVTGALGAAGTLLYMALMAFVGVAALTGEDAAEALPGVGVMLALSLVGLVAAGFIIYAGLKMRQLEGWGLSMAGAIVAMIPCLSPCCLLGLPIGIWAILVLIDEEIKRAFGGGTGGFSEGSGGSYPGGGYPGGGYPGGGYPGGSTPGGGTGGYPPPPPPPPDDMPTQR